MIDFKNIGNLAIVKKFSYEGNEYFLREASQLDYEKARDEAGEDGEKLMYLMWKMTLCDESGKLLELSPDDIKAIPVGLIKDICSSIQELAGGKKKA